MKKNNKKNNKINNKIQHDRKNVHKALKYSDLDENDMMSLVMKKLNTRRNQVLSQERRKEIAILAVKAREAKKKKKK